MKPQKLHIIRILLILLGMSAMGMAFAQDITSRLSFRRFTTLDGLPQMQTETVWQDERGYIYVGTLSGFARYDGLMMMPYMQGRRVNIVSFCEIGDEVRAMGFGRYWIFDDGHLSLRQMDPNGQLMLNNFNSPDLPQGTILLENPYSCVWLSDPIGGWLGYSRDGYLYTFNYKGKAGRKEHISIKGTNRSTTLYIDGKLVQELGIEKRFASEKKQYNYIRTLIFPLQKTGAFSSQITNFKAKKI